MFRQFLLMFCLGMVVGCGKNKEEVIEVKDHDPMKNVKATLMNYVKGQPVTSEVTSYDYLVEEVRKIDPAKAEILKAGLEEIKKVKGSPAAKARELLKKLGLSDKPD